MSTLAVGNGLIFSLVVLFSCHNKDCIKCPKEESRPYPNRLVQSQNPTSMSFSFSFRGDDIEDDKDVTSQVPSAPSPAASAFPVQGKPLLPPLHHDLNQLLAALPSKIAYSLLDVDLDGKASIQIPRRELWDVRVQLMAEDDGPGHVDGDELEPGLGSHDVKTGIYEGGFKSWESSVDMVKVLAAEDFNSSSLTEGPVRVIEVSGWDSR